VMALSRRGLLPAAHATAPLPRIDPQSWLEPMLHAGITTRALARHIGRAMREADLAGQSGHQVIDGLRPHISRIWTSLPPEEKSRFLRHARTFWEVVRHRMAPAVAHEVSAATKAGVFSVAAARVVSAQGDLDGATLTVRRRGQSAYESQRFDWVVNCTGPGTGKASGFPPGVAQLIDAKHLQMDSDRLGVRSTPSGQALVDAHVSEDLLVVGSLRKADDWESTAVPELRVQAALAAEAIMKLLQRSGTQLH
jgi:uncharacterized NAD(P)/FAD-binding protein YdhS